VDLSHPIVDGMITYPGLPGPRLRTHISRSESGARLATGVSFHIGAVDLVANTGTYVDAPFHRVCGVGAAAFRRRDHAVVFSLVRFPLRSGVRVFSCVACGVTGNADVNAAVNVAAGQPVTRRAGRAGTPGCAGGTTTGNRPSVREPQQKTPARTVGVE